MLRLNELHAAQRLWRRGLLSSAGKPSTAHARVAVLVGNMIGEIINLFWIVHWQGGHARLLAHVRLGDRLTEAINRRPRSYMRTPYKSNS